MKKYSSSTRQTSLAPKKATDPTPSTTTQINRQWPLARTLIFSRRDASLKLGTAEHLSITLVPARASFEKETFRDSIEILLTLSLSLERSQSHEFYTGTLS